MIASEPKPGGTATVYCNSQVALYNLHCGDSDTSILIGSDDMSLNGVCTTFSAEKILDMILARSSSLKIVSTFNQSCLLNSYNVLA